MNIMVLYLIYEIIKGKKCKERIVVFGVLFFLLRGFVILCNWRLNFEGDLNLCVVIVNIKN